MNPNKIVFATVLVIFICGEDILCGQEPGLNSGIDSEIFYFQSSALFKCHIKLPENYEPDQPHNLVIGLHGGVATPESFIKIGMM